MSMMDDGNVNEIPPQWMCGSAIPECNAVAAIYQKAVCVNVRDEYKKNRKEREKYINTGIHESDHR